MMLRSQLLADIQNFLRTGLLLVCIVVLWGVPARAQTPDDPNRCGPIANHYGPFDYRTQRDKLKIVEGAHFVPEVEALIRGHRGHLAQDISYTLHTSPNHHRALIAVWRFSEKMKSPQPKWLPRPVECYFDRAIRFAPDDTVVRILYAQFLAKNGRSNESLPQLDVAVTYAKDNPFSHYNIGLAYFDLKQFDKALVQAHRAAVLGFDRTELADQLKAVDQWKESAN